MMDEQSVKSILKGIVKSDSPLGWAHNFDFRNNNLDSLDVVTLALKLEEATGFRIPDEKVDELRSIDDVMRVISEVSS